MLANYFCFMAMTHLMHP